MEDRPNFIEPCFSLRSLHGALMHPETSRENKVSALRGLHIKFWHASQHGVRRMLLRVGHGKDVLKMLREVVVRCPCVRRSKPTLTKPLQRTRLAEHVGHWAQADLFFRWGPHMLRLHRRVHQVRADMPPTRQGGRLLAHVFLRHVGLLLRAPRSSGPRTNKAP